MAFIWACVMRLGRSAVIVVVVITVIREFGGENLSSWCIDRVFNGGVFFMFFDLFYYAADRIDKSG
ncbi:hypothetical protein CMI37_16205 [Candidatus Pacearchaeota archaeon]|nr:hypothetical protein [Candidatus Pacearchaeota archaeon]